MSKKLIRRIDTLLFYDGELIIQGEDEFVFVLLDEEKQTYIGKQLNPKQLRDYTTSQIGLREVYEASKNPFYTAKYKKGSKGEILELTEVKKVTEEMMPEYGAFLNGKTDGKTK